MRRTSLLVAALGLTAFAASAGADDQRSDLHVLYIGNAQTERAEAFETFLRERFARAEVAARDGFDPAQAEKFDVVLLDWSQSDIDRSQGFFEVMQRLESPLGPRADWATPTVLLDSAGLLIAAPWQTQGAYG